MAARVRDVVWAESARDALDAVLAYIAQDSQQAAAQVLDEAHGRKSLGRFHRRGKRNMRLMIAAEHPPTPHPSRVRVSGARAPADYARIDGLE